LFGLWFVFSSDRLVLIMTSDLTVKDILLRDDAVSVLHSLDASGKLAEVEPSLANLRMPIPKGYHHKDNLTHSIQVLANAIERELEGPDLILRAAALFHDIGKPKVRKFHGKGLITFDNHEMAGARMISGILRKHDFSEDEVEEVSLLTSLHMRSHGFTSEAWTDSGVRRLMTEAGDDETLKRLVIIFYADATSKIPGKVARLHESVDNLVAALDEVKLKDARAALRPAINGTDVMELFGLPAGRELGAVMRFLNSDEGLALSREEALSEVGSRFSLKLS
jgi:poly(A) polymerase